MPVLCNFNWVLCMGGETSFCVRNFFCCLCMIRLHSCIFFVYQFLEPICGIFGQCVEVIVFE